jgi:hypothetical protein
VIVRPRNTVSQLWQPALSITAAHAPAPDAVSPAAGCLTAWVYAGPRASPCAVERDVSRMVLRPGTVHSGVRHRRMRGSTGCGRIWFVVVRVELVQVPGVETVPVQRALRSVVRLVQPFRQQPVKAGLLGVIGVKPGPRPERLTFAGIQRRQMIRYRHHDSPPPNRSCRSWPGSPTIRPALRSSHR